MRSAWSSKALVSTAQIAATGPSAVQMGIQAQTSQVQQVKPRQDEVSRQAAGRRGLGVQRLQQWQATGLQRSIIHRVDIRRKLALWTTRTISVRVLSVQA